jgi:hypothetical protein
MTSDGQGSSYDVVIDAPARPALQRATTFHKGLSFLILDAGPEIGHLWQGHFFGG